MAAWLRIRRNRPPFYRWTPSLVVTTILERASRDKALDYDQAYRIGRKAAEKYSGNWRHTLQAALPWQAADWSDKGCRMRRGDWNAGWVFEQERQKREQERRAEFLVATTNEALDECKRTERPYSLLGGGKTFWQRSYLYRLEMFSQSELFFSYEVDEREEGEDFVRVNSCESCRDIGGPKKVRYYGWKKGLLCIPCWNRSKPIWKAEKEYLETKKLINKLDKERLIWQRSQTQAS